MPNVPTSGETFAKMIHHVREAQSCAAILAHLANANDERTLAKQWLVVQELLKKMIHQLTSIATRRLN